MSKINVYFSLYFFYAPTLNFDFIFERPRIEQFLSFERSLENSNEELRKSFRFPPLPIVLYIFSRNLHRNANPKQTRRRVLLPVLTLLRNTNNQRICLWLQPTNVSMAWLTVSTIPWETKHRLSTAKRRRKICMLISSFVSRSHISNLSHLKMD